MARRLGVSRQDVIDAAVVVSDRDGLDDLTVASVANEVGCRPPSVYHHVDGLQGLLREVSLVAAADLTATLDATAAEHDGIEAVSAIAAAARSWAADRPARFDALRREPDGEDEELATARREVLRSLYEAIAGLGVPEPAVPSLVAAIEAALRGCIAAERDSTSHGDPDLADARRAGHELLMGLILGHISQAAGDGAPDPSTAGSTTTSGSDDLMVEQPSDATP